jgi:hypothetical protein
MHFALGTRSPVTTTTKAAASVVSLLTGCPALGTTTGLIGKAPFSIEFLLGSREVKLRATVTAGQGFVLVHEDILLKISLLNGVHLSLLSITIKRLRRINELGLSGLFIELKIYFTPNTVESKTNCSIISIFKQY